MKRFTLILIFLLIYPKLAFSQVMRELNTTVEILEDNRIDVEIFFKFTDEIKEVDFPLPTRPYDLESKNNNCRIEERIKTLLVCEPPSPFMVGEIIVGARFKMNDMIERRDNISYFKFDIPILWVTDKSVTIVKLPTGTVLIDNSLLPLSPSGADIGSDGRRIVLKWQLENQRMGDVIPIRVQYEAIAQVNIVERIGIKWVVLSLLIIITGYVVIHKRISKRSELVLSVLNEGERLIFDIIRNSKKDKISQRKIVELSGFSKAKVSRTIQSLEERGIVTVERFGRTNKISLKRKFIGE